MSLLRPFQMVIRSVTSRTSAAAVVNNPSLDPITQASDEFTPDYKQLSETEKAMFGEAELTSKIVEKLHEDNVHISDLHHMKNLDPQTLESLNEMIDTQQDN